METPAHMNKTNTLEPEICSTQGRTLTASTIHTLSNSKFSRTFNQYGILLWKSYVIRRRHPFLLCAEILFPILFVSILAVFRSQQSLSLEPACHVQSQSMPSMGMLHYVQSMICNFNYTCQPVDPDRVEGSNNFGPLIYMLHNLTELAKDPTLRELLSDSSPFQVSNFFQWTVLAPKLIDFYTAYSNAMDWVSVHYPLIQSSLTLGSLKNISILLCGSNTQLTNDIWRAIQLIEERQAQDAEPSSTWDSLLEDIPSRNLTDLPANLTQGQRRAQLLNLCDVISHLLTLKPIYNTMGRLRHFLFGKVAYYPSNAWTDHIIRQSDTTTDVFRQLRNLTQHYFHVTRPWLVDYLSDPKKIEPLRDRFAKCANSDSAFLTSKMTTFCQFSLGWLNQSGDNSSTFSHWLSSLDQLDFVMGLAEDLLTNCFEVDQRFVGFDDYEAWMQYLASDPSRLRLTTLGLNLNSSTDAHGTASNVDSNFLFTLTLRKEFPFIDGTFKYKVLDRYWNPRPRRDPQMDMKYFTSGFIDLQEQLSRALIQSLDNRTGLSQPKPSRVGVQMKPFPSGPYKDDKFLDFFSTSLPQLMILAWALSVVVTVKYLVDETEDNLAVILHALGISKWVNQLAWLTSSIVLMFVLLVPTILILKFGQIIPLADSCLMFLFISSYVISCITFALLLSTLFRRANLAAIVTGVVYFLLYLPAPLLLRHEAQFAPSTLILASLIPQIGYSLGWSLVTRLEVHGSGAKWDKLWNSGNVDDPFCLGLVICLLWSSAWAYLVLTLLSNRLRPLLLLDSSILAWPGRKYVLGSQFKRSKRPTPAMMPNHKPNSSGDMANFVELDHVPLKTHTAPGTPHLVKPSVTVRNVSKYFRPNQTPALNSISLEFYPNQITVLLGPNGAGKTTLISILVGLLEPTNGRVQVQGHDLHNQLDSVRHRIGYCPQHDILYSNLTVWEHVRLFGILKNLNMAELGQQIDSYLDELGLANKRHALAKTLSGGQKRKLSLFLACMGPTSVVVLDEPTAGLDPLSKITVWEMLKSMRQSRTIILSSHNMRETEILADQIAVISQGQLYVTGSLGELCTMHSPGYRIGLERELARPDFDAEDVQQILSVCQHYVRDTVIVSQYPWKLILGVSSQSAYDGNLEALFSHLESEEFKQLSGVTYLGLVDIPLDELFLDAIGFPPTADLAAPTYERHVNGVCHTNSNHSNNNCQHVSHVDDSPGILYSTGELNVYRRQICALLLKRFYFLKRNKLACVIQFILPCLLVLISLLFVQFFRPKVSHPPMDIHPWLVQTKRVPHLVHFYAENDRVSDLSPPFPNSYSHSFEKSHTWTGTRCLSARLYQPTPRPSRWGCSQFDFELNSWSNATCSKYYPGTNQNAACRLLSTGDVMVNLTGFELANHLVESANRQLVDQLYGGLELTPISDAYLNQLLKNALTIDGNRSTNVWLESLNLIRQMLPPDHVIRIWYNNKGYTSAPAYLNMLHNVELRNSASQITDPSLVGLVVVNHPLTDVQISFYFNFRETLKSDSVVALFLLLAFAFIPANFVIPLIQERHSQAKHLQFLAGLKPFVYWFVNWSCDLLIYALSILICLFLLIGFQKQAYISLPTIGPFSLVVLLYGMAMIPLVYLTSFIFPHPSTGFVFMCALNLLISSITTTVSFFLNVMSLQYPDLKSVSEWLTNLFRLFPHFCMGSTIYDLAINAFMVGHGLRKPNLSTAWHLLWPNMVFLTLQSVVFGSLVMSIEYGLFRWISRVTRGRCRWIGSFQGHHHRRRQPYRWTSQNSVSDHSIDSESAFVQAKSPAVELEFVSKSYGFTSKPVLSNLNFSVSYGHCLGLVGSNGAGKSTTYSILSGQRPPSQGCVRIHGRNIDWHPVSLGYCPQHDALHDFLTVRETLTMYGHFHVIPLAALPNQVTLAMKQTGLTQYADCLTSILSGGNKRKLSTAIAFLGQPRLILLDEPSNGMDVLSKKLLWSNINQALRQNKSAVVMSSHYMDECELLCQQIGLLDQGRLRCMGQPLDLRHRQPADYIVRLLLNEEQLDKLGADQFEQMMQTHLPEFRARLPMTLKQECTCSGLLSLSHLFGLVRKVRDSNLITGFTIRHSGLEDTLVQLARSPLGHSNSS